MIIFVDKSAVYSTIRYCNQDMFNALVYVGYDKQSDQDVENINEVDGTSFKSLKYLHSVIEGGLHIKRFYFIKDVYFNGGFNNNHKYIRSTVKYSSLSETCEKVSDLSDARNHFSVCSLIYVLFSFMFSNAILGVFLQLIHA